ncbi:MAG: 2-oxoacid:acceptor oxidoreductase subunit alpha [Deltaproteobacteria bacterium]|nr:2-oxoacid:acceptor oxidoreductase subunit alpha [Deltaproteobacteria bacterium]
MPETVLNIMIGGEAGQGLVTIGQLLAKSFVRAGYFIVVTQSYQSRIRGGHNTYSIRVSPDEIQASQESVDLLVALDKETIDLHQDEMSARGLIVVDEAFDRRGDNYVLVPYKQLSPERFANIAGLGVLSVMLGLDAPLVATAMDEFFGKKNEEMVKQNSQVLVGSRAWAEALDESWTRRLPAVTNPQKRLLLNGNEAIALGALSAGVKFLSFYPMSPATSIALTLAAKAEAMGLIVEQAEDEIAAINMALGASYAGAAAMVSTSGGGFALMVEGVSLAAMTETPIVIVVAQRPGPATGLPTRTEQGDLEFVLHSGHGEFPKGIFAPGTVEQNFYLTRRAFELAEEFQGPMFVLTDQFMADSYRAVTPFEVADLPAVRPIELQILPKMDYQRYAITESGVSPRLLPGYTKHLIGADSDEHTTDGHLTEDLAVRIQMQDKRYRKLTGLSAEVTPPEYRGDEHPDLLLVCWGTTLGAVHEAATRLKTEGRSVGTLHFSQVWPLVPEQFVNYLNGAKQVVAVEGNATGQFARLIRTTTGFHISRQILRYDGLPITPEYILKNLASV